MKKFIGWIKSLITRRRGVVWLTLADKVQSEGITRGGSAKDRRSQIREYCKNEGIIKPWSLTSLETRKWKVLE
jgi:hypothetical protein